MMFDAVREFYIGELPKLSIQVLLLFGVALYLLVVTLFEVHPVERRDGVCGLLELICSLLIVAIAIFVV
jgi:hypothetical protein